MAQAELGTLGATAASGVLGIAVAIGLTIAVTNNFSAQSALVPSAPIHQSTGASEAEIIDRQQLDLLRAAKLVIERFPELDVDSSNRDQAAIDYVVRVRDGYLAKGHAIDIALRMAANDYANEIHRQTQVRLNQNAVVPSNSHGSFKTFTYAPSSHNQQDGRPKCNIQAVMTDAEIAACR